MQQKLQQNASARGAKRESTGERRPYHHGDLRAALMAAAISLIEQFGVKGFSLKDAAALAGVSTAAPYRHFADKAALVEALRSEGFQLFNAALAQAYERGETPSSRILELGVAYVLFAIRHPAHIRVMFGLSRNHGSPSEPNADISKNAEAQQAKGESSGFLLLVKAVDGMLPAASPQVRQDAVVACWSVVHGFALLQMEGVWAATMQLGNPEDQLRRTLSLLIEGTLAAQH